MHTRLHFQTNFAYNHLGHGILKKTLWTFEGGLAASFQDYEPEMIINKLKLPNHDF
jgi:hypothetical protein